jgi:hypothetical protein
MAGQMTVVAVRRTGHVLGAITGVAPAGEPTVAGVAGDALPARFDTMLIDVPAAELAVAVLGFDANVFTDPHDARVVFPTQSDQDPILTSVIGSASGQLRSSGLTADQLEVELTPAGTPAPTAATPFVVVFQGPGDEPPVIVSGEIPANATVSPAVTHSLTSGTTYDALVLLAGYAQHPDSAVVP